MSKRHHAPATPAQRLLKDPGTLGAVSGRVGEPGATLDPIRLLRRMRVHRQCVVDIADRPAAGRKDTTVPPLEQFLAGLRTAWADGGARPTAMPLEKPKRERRRPDPLVKVTEQLRAWFEAEPWNTSRQLLEKLQAAHPGEYPDNLLRTLQRRVRVWRREKATAMVFGELPAVEWDDEADQMGDRPSVRPPATLKACRFKAPRHGARRKPVSARSAPCARLSTRRDRPEEIVIEPPRPQGIAQLNMTLCQWQPKTAHFLATENCTLPRRAFRP